MNTDKPCTQAEFAALVGVDQSTVSRLLKNGTLRRGGTLADWIMDYIEHRTEEAVIDGGGSELRESRAAYFAARARIAQIEADEREGKVVAVDETVTFILDVVTGLLQKVRHGVPLVVEVVRNWPEPEQIRVADDGMKKLFDQEMGQRELAHSTCCPAVLGAALAKRWTGRLAEEVLERLERRIAVDKRKRALETEIAALEKKTGRSSGGES